MTLPRDVFLNASHDLDKTFGIRLTSSLPEYVRQKLTQRLRFFLGEWFIDRRLGVPYWTRVFISNPDLSLLTSLYRQVILKTRGVGGVENLVLTFDRRTRTLTTSFVAVCVDTLDKVVFSDEPFVLQTPADLGLETA
jgi:hypothetical protein